MENIDITAIIEEEKIIIYYQPIISTYQDRVAGVEALVRGVDEGGKLIPPMMLFEAAKKADVVIALDRLCQKKAIEGFSNRLESQKDMILFLNVDNSVIHLDTNTNAIFDYSVSAGVNPGNIVLEINELDSANMVAVQKFVKSIGNTVL